MDDPTATALPTRPPIAAGSGAGRQHRVLVRSASHLAVRVRRRDVRAARSAPAATCFTGQRVCANETSGTEGAVCPPGLVCSVLNIADQSDAVVHLASLPRTQAWSLRAMQPSTMLKIGRAPWLDAQDLPNYSEWPKYITTILVAPLRARLMIDMTQFSHPLQPQQPPRPATCGVDVERAHRRSLVASRHERYRLRRGLVESCRACLERQPRVSDRSTRRWLVARRGSRRQANHAGVALPFRRSC